jgi:pyruvate formate lyase activating enzyme
MNFYEYMLDTAIIARKKGILNVAHTAAYVNQQPLEKLAPLLDAVNVDLKGFSEQYYRDLCQGELKVVLNALKIFKKHKVWIEITNLILPGHNDDEKEIEKMCLWIKENLGEGTPVHFSRFHPMYQMKHLPSTPVSSLKKAVEIAKGTGLKYVYMGNVPGSNYENTYCPKCGKLLIKRVGFSVLQNNLVDGKCKFCGEKIEGIWKRK